MLRSFIIFLISLTVTVILPQTVSLPFTHSSILAVTASPINSVSSGSQVASQVSTNSSNFSSSLLQQGITLYENQQFSEAVQRWQQANQDFISEGNILGQALTLSNLSLAYQQLGQLDLAAQSLNQSLQLLESEQSDRSAEYTEIYAKALNTQGKLYWLQNQLESALDAWQRAAQTYAEAGNQAGMMIAQMNQARALQALGFSHQALDILQQIYRSIQQSLDDE